MSKKKSLGSSPIGLSTSGSMGFIPSLDDGNMDAPVAEKDAGGVTQKTAGTKQKTEKKTVSYYLDTRLIAEVKEAAQDKDICYSALVSTILKGWLKGIEKQ